eukprot:TRINITY_DN25303_c0_g2_i1.p1 TRINITY_DN25303_c0_g2~~TRINITY_DN25303_c0_g2_i1.p1  ORF type:complete len:2248 (-),score=601.64 TRINITY_DN25303_c0_g2_i1:355-7038(-)
MACIFCFGSCLTELDNVDYKKQFSTWWKNEMKTVKYPSKGVVFDFFLRDTRIEEWTMQVERAHYEVGTPMGEVTVPTSETVSMNYMMKALIQVQHPVMLIGLAGCGKTQSCAGLLKRLDATQFAFHKMNMSYYTDSTLLQTMMEGPLEKKAGKLFAPPGKLQLIYFIDDLNMPMLDKYNTQSAIELMKQKQDYNHWYDRSKIIAKDIGNTQYLCCMNPTAGSFTINPRLQRHFWTATVQFPESSALSTIYSTFMSGHFHGLGFKHQVVDMTIGIIKAALSLHSSVTSQFRKTAKNMHYEFNIRHMSGVFAGLLQARPTEFPDAEKLALLWLHESERIYGDRLVSVADLKRFRAMLAELVKKMFSKYNFQKYFLEKSPEPLVFVPFSKGIQDMAIQPTYDKILSIERLSEVLHEGLREYNNQHAAMDLVLFEDAMKHVAKICRIICCPAGHPLLVGVGGSGRQSLSRLSAFVCQAQTFMIVIRTHYNIGDLKTDLQYMFKRAGEKDEGVLFLFTDNQISNERFLVLFNDLLSSGEITDLYANEDKDMIRNAVRGACKGAGMVDTPENLWNFYITRVRKNLHMSLCFSPVGDGMWSRARKFPALVNCTVIDWFQPWPLDALHNVAAKFLAPVEQLGSADDPQRLSIVAFLPFSFDTVNSLSQEFIEKERRYAYTTPKSFLELIKLFIKMLQKTYDDLMDKKQRLTNGLVKLRTTQDSVASLEMQLKETAVVVQEKAEKADQFAEEVGREKAKVNAEAERAQIEAAKCEQIAVQVAAQKEDCTRDLAEATPLVKQAEDALDVLDKNDFNEMKKFTRPPHGVDTVCEAAMNLMAGFDPNIDVDKRGRLKDRSFKGAIKMMSDPTKFLFNLKSYKTEIDALRVPEANVEEARRLKDSLGSDFCVEVMSKKAQAAGGLCGWIINILKYYDIVKMVEPKKKGLDQAKEQLEIANKKFKEMRQHVSQLEAQLAELMASYDKAIEDKNNVMNEAARCQYKLELAQRLVGALSANGVIWEQTVEKTSLELVHICGDVLVACSFASYVGVFGREYREEATSRFVEFLAGKDVALSEVCDPLLILSTETQQARWCSKGLPNDRVSLENGAIMGCSSRWCLMIDPQTQGIIWVKNKEAENKLQVTRMGHADMVKTFEGAIEKGSSVLIENMSEHVEAVLQPVIARNTIRRQGKEVLKLGDKEIKYNRSFTLFMQTKLSNPHYPPEIQAECTVINFTVTPQGLEEQMLFLVVKLERPDLARKKAELIQQQNEYKMKLADLETLLLEKLASCEGDILDDVDLIIGLEEAKLTSDEVMEKVKTAANTEAKINDTSEHYREPAQRSALIFFLMSDLSNMHSFYKYSLEAFVMVVTRAINGISLRPPKENVTTRQQAEDGNNEALPQEVRATIKGSLQLAAEDVATLERASSGDEEEKEEGEEDEEEVDEPIVELRGKDLAKRVEVLRDTVTASVFSYVRRGLLDADKLTVAAMLVLRILVNTGVIQASELTMLIQAPPDPSASSMPDNARVWLTEMQWAQLKSLEKMTAFKSTQVGLTQHMEQDSLGWRRWFGEDKAEAADLPRACRDLKPFYRLFLLRIIRPDRIGNALTQFVVDNLGQEFVEQQPFDIEQCYEETTSATPMFFVLFPGTDPTSAVEAFARKRGMTDATGRFVNISMGQGQEKTAINALTKAAKEGTWVMLQNIHLMQMWLRQLERTLEVVDECAHPDFRIILTSEPPSVLQGALHELVPEAILQRCVKVADEAPTDLKSNLKRAFGKFSAETIEACAKPREFKATLFALCFFHSLIQGRIKFGAQGWSKKYPFNDGDLTICAQVLANYLNNADRLGTEVPWPDLRYIFGEIMYGGHITDFWDRRVCNTYLSTLVKPELLNNLQMAPGLKSPDASKTDYAYYQKFIEERFPPEQPQLFGLHPNAEVGFLTNQGISIFKTIQKISGVRTGTGVVDISAATPIISKYLEELPHDLDMVSVRNQLKEEDYTPYVMSSLQESDRMNLLLGIVRSSLQELELGIGGQLNVTEGMEQLAESLQALRVDSSWQKYAYPSLKSLRAWFADLLRRQTQLAKWTNQRVLPFTVWISGLFNAMAFLTAVMQVTARERSLPLDYMTNRTQFTNNRDAGDLVSYPMTGVYVDGLFLEGASWEDGKGDDEGYIADSKMKELHIEMPIMNVFSVHIDQMDWQNMYHCPVFITSQRGATFVVKINMRMDPDDDEMHWILAGTALMLTDD